MGFARTSGHDGSAKAVVQKPARKQGRNSQVGCYALAYARARARFCTLFVSHHGRNGYFCTNLCNLCLNIGEFLVDNILARKKQIISHLKDNKRRRNKLLHLPARFKIYLGHIQSPQVAEINIKGERYTVKFMKITVFPNLPAFEPLKGGVLYIVQMYLSQLGDGQFPFGYRKPLLQNARPGLRIRITYGSQPYSGVFDIIVEKLQMAAGRRQRFGQAVDEE